LVETCDLGNYRLNCTLHDLGNDSFLFAVLSLSPSGGRTAKAKRDHPPEPVEKPASSSSRQFFLASTLASALSLRFVESIV
jgi:hypothetical protein